MQYVGRVARRCGLRPATCCRMQLRAATKQTRFESSEKGSINQGFHERFYRRIFSWFIYPLPFETSGTASRGSIWYIYICIAYFFCCSLLHGAGGLPAMGLTLSGPPILLRYSSNILLKLCSDLIKPNHKGQAVTMRGCNTVLWVLPFQLDF